MKNFIIGFIALSTFSAYAGDLPTCLDGRKNSEKSMAKRIGKQVDTFVNGAYVTGIKNLKFSYLSVNATTTEMTVTYMATVLNPSPSADKNEKVYRRAFEAYSLKDQGNGDGCAVINSDKVIGNLIFTEDQIAKP